MEQLPDEVLMMIFERVPSHDILASVPRVCARWAALAARRAACVRRRADLRRLHAGVALLLVAARLPSLRELVALAPTAAPHLRELTLHAVNPFDGESLAALARLPHLDHLDVFVRFRIVDERLVPAMTRLSSVVINENVAPGVLRAVAARGRLRALHMFGRAHHCPPRELRAALTALGRTLRELTLRCSSLPDSAYAALAQCGSLHSLQLYACWQLRAEGARHVARPSLRRLHVTGARMLRPPALAALVGRLPTRLEELVLSATRFGGEHVAALTERCPALRSLELWRCRLTSADVLRLQAGLPALRALDVDLLVSEECMRALKAHPSLVDLRCLSAGRPPELARHGRAEAAGWRREVPAAAVPWRMALGGEGYRASLFHFWTQHGRLGPLLPDDDANCSDGDEYFSNV